MIQDFVERESFRILHGRELIEKIFRTYPDSDTLSLWLHHRHRATGYSDESGTSVYD
jgi:hypothetical protein